MGCYWFLVVQVRDTATHPTAHRTAFQDEELASRIVNSVRLRTLRQAMGERRAFWDIAGLGAGESSTSLTVRTLTWLKLGDDGWERSGQAKHVNR